MNYELNYELINVDLLTYNFKTRSLHNLSLEILRMSQVYIDKRYDCNIFK